MAAMTKTQLRDAIKREARVNTADLDTLIYEIMDDVIADIFSKERCYELRVIGTGTAMSTGVATITLPTDFQHVDEVRWSIDSGVTFEPVKPKNDAVYNSKIGAPKFWQLVGATLYVFPYSQVTTAHKIYLDYFSLPNFDEDSDLFPVFRLQAAFKKECITRVLDYHNQLQQSERMLASAGQSLERGKSANLEARNLDSADTRQPNFETVPKDTK